MTEYVRNSDPVPVQDPREAAAVLWQEVSDELIAGIHHALNNRLGALSAIIQVLSEGIGTEAAVRSTLGEEIVRIQNTVRSLSLLPRYTGSVEPVMVPDCLASVMELYGYHALAREISCEVDCSPDLLPVRADPTELTHLLLVLLHVEAKASRSEGGVLRIRCAGDAEEVVIRIDAGRGAAVPTSRVAGSGAQGWAAAALRSWGAAMGGELRASGEGAGGSGPELRFPTLLALRRGGRRAARPPG